MRSFRILLLIASLAALLPFAFVGWQDLYEQFLERKGPKITIVEQPRGFGLAPVSLVVELEDPDSGLSEVVVRSVQSNRQREVLRKTFSGDKKTRIRISFNGKESGLEEGTIGLEIRAFDSSFWVNSSELVRAYRVDLRKPKLEVVSRQHNARLGGSQMIFYRAIDENLAFSGVKVGNEAFAGYPARVIDPDFTQPDLYVALYAVNIKTDPSRARVRLFAEDEAGNVNSMKFYNKILPRKVPVSKVELSDSYLRNQVQNLFSASRKRLDQEYAQRGEKLVLGTSSGSSERLLEQFVIVEEDLRSLDELEVLSSLGNSRHDWYWDLVFETPLGTALESFGQKVRYQHAGKNLGARFTDGYLFAQLRGASDEVTTAADGVVVFARDMGVYGRAVAVDHGLGLSTLYGHLNSIDVVKGQKIERGEVIGGAGTTGLARKKGFLFQVRVNGKTTDPREWWDTRWYLAHISGKINEVKKIVGVPLGRSF